MYLPGVFSSSANQTKIWKLLKISLNFCCNIPCDTESPQKCFRYRQNDSKVCWELCERFSIGNDTSLLAFAQVCFWSFGIVTFMSLIKYSTGIGFASRLTSLLYSSLHAWKKSCKIRNTRSVDNFCILTEIENLQGLASWWGWPQSWPWICRVSLITPKHFSEV